MRATAYTFILLFSLLAGFTSCEMKKELTGGLKPVNPGEEPIDPSVTGVLDLKLNLNPETDTQETKAKADVAATVDVNDFSIQIIDSTGTVVRCFDSYREYQEADELLLKAGLYTIRATWGKLYEAAFDAPYFIGDTVCRIEPGVVSSIKTDCNLLNAKVNIDYTDDFLKVFKDDYAAVVTNGLGVLTMDKKEQRVAYFRSDDNIRLTVNATTIKGLDVISKHKIEKAQPNVLYNVVLGIDMSVDSVIDQVLKPGITVDITMHDRDTIIEIEAPPLPPDPDEGTDGEEGEGKPSIKGIGIDLSQPINMTEADALAGNVKMQIQIEAPNKLSSLTVDINTTNEELQSVMKEISPFDLLNLTEEMDGILSGVGMTSRPAKGETSFLFDITDFMKLLGVGKHYFKIKVIDEAGIDSGDCNITINIQ